MYGELNGRQYLVIFQCQNECIFLQDGPSVLGSLFGVITEFYISYN